MNSPWGLIGHVAEKHSYKFEYVLEKISLANIYMMLADKPKLVKRSEIIVKVNKKDLKKHREQLKKNG